MFFACESAVFGLQFAAQTELDFRARALVDFLQPYIAKSQRTRFSLFISHFVLKKPLLRLSYASFGTQNHRLRLTYASAGLKKLLCTLKVGMY